MKIYQPGERLTQEDFIKAFEYTFNHYDENKDGKLSLLEFKKMYNSINLSQQKDLPFLITH